MSADSLRPPCTFGPLPPGLPSQLKIRTTPPNLRKTKKNFSLFLSKIACQPPNNAKSAPDANLSVSHLPRAISYSVNRDSKASGEKAQDTPNDRNPL
jgi:hypothetical protein